MARPLSWPFWQHGGTFPGSHFNSIENLCFPVSVFGLAPTLSPFLIVDCAAGANVHLFFIPITGSQFPWQHTAAPASSNLSFFSSTAAHWHADYFMDPRANRWRLYIKEDWPDSSAHHGPSVALIRWLLLSSKWERSYSIGMRGGKCTRGGNSSHTWNKAMVSGRSRWLFCGNQESLARLFTCPKQLKRYFHFCV